MILKTEEDLSCKDIEVLIRYAEMNDHVEQIISRLKSLNTRIKCSHDGNEYFINACDIYYLESVDKRSFVYLEKAIYQTEFRLYQLAEQLKHLGFVQISKSCVLNVNMLEYIRPLMNSRMEATLKNGERLYITRKYLSAVKQSLQEEIRI